MLQGVGDSVVLLGGEQVEVQAEARRTDPGQQVQRRIGGAAVHHRLGAGGADRLDHRLQRRRRPLRVDRAVPAEARGRRDRTGEHGGQGRLVDLHQDLRPRHPTAYVGDVLGEPLGERLGQLATGTVVGEHPVTARPLHGRGERPRTGDLDLHRPAVALGLLLPTVEVLREQRPRSALVDPGRVGQAPAGRLQVGGEPGQEAGGAADHVGVRPSAGHLGQVGQVGQLAEHDPHRLVEVVLVVAGVRPDTRGQAHRSPPTRAAERSVAEIVHDPTTRVPS